MRHRLETQLEGALQALVAATVVAVGLAAGNVYPWNEPIGRAARWVALAELAAVAVAYVAFARRGTLGRAFTTLACAFIGVAAASAAWSADASLTLLRAATVAAVFAIAGAVGSVAVRREAIVEVVAVGVVVGVAILAICGVANALVDIDRAVVPATTQSPARYSGIGGNPNTMAMLIALAFPLLVWGLSRSPSRARAAAGGALLVLLFVSMVASGSRGALVGAAVGVSVFALAAPGGRRLRIALIGGALGLTAVGIAAAQIPQPAKTNPVIRYDIVPPPTPPLSALDAQPKLPLESEVGFPRPDDEPFRRTLFTSSGRADAWRGAVEQAFRRPLLGYGFGTEERVFVDRYYLHYSERPENSYIGTFLQLGVVGLALLLGVIAIAIAQIRRARSAATAACSGVVVAGVVLGLTQSYLTSAGSPSMLPFWLCAFITAAWGGSRTDASRERHDPEADEREEDAAERHRESRLDVVDPDHDRVNREERDDAAARAAARDGDR